MIEMQRMNRRWVVGGLCVLFGCGDSTGTSSDASTGGSSTTGSAATGQVDTTANSTGSDTTATPTDGSASATGAPTTGSTTATDTDTTAATDTGSESSGGSSSSGPDPACGDGNVDPGEECDDANADNSDPCLDNCKLSACGAIDPNTCPGNSKSELYEKNVSIAINNLGDKWDDKYNGTIASMLCNDIIVPASSLQLIGGMSLKVGMDHMYVGDLTIKIVSPENKIFTPLSRPSLEPGQPFKDDGTPCCGDSSNLLAAFPLTFADDAVISGKEIGKDPLDTNGVVCKDENPKIDPCAFKPYPGLAPGKDFTDFKGVKAAGTWKVCIGDSGPGDFGLLQYIGLNITRVKYAPK